MKNIYPATSEELSEINLTPMLDVVFIMLIFFVVTASFIKEFGLDITLPAGGEVLPQELETIKVVIEYDDSFHVNGRALAVKEIRPVGWAPTTFSCELAPASDYLSVARLPSSGDENR